MRIKGKLLCSVQNKLHCCGLRIFPFQQQPLQCSSVSVSSGLFEWRGIDGSHPIPLEELQSAPRLIKSSTNSILEPKKHVYIPSHQINIIFMARSEYAEIYPMQNGHPKLIGIICPNCTLTKELSEFWKVSFSYNSPYRMIFG
jgi:hypothetical protein